MENNKMMTTIVVILVIVAAALGVVYWMKSQDKSTTTTTNSTTNTGKNSNSSSTSNSNSAPSASAIQSALNFKLSRTPSQDEYKQFAELVSKAATYSTTLDVSGCSPKPQVLRLEEGQALKVKNNDSQAHKLMSNTDLFFTAEAKSDAEVKPDFKNGKGIYSYTCDNGSRAIIELVPPRK